MEGCETLHVTDDHLDITGIETGRYQPYYTLQTYRYLKN